MPDSTTVTEQDLAVIAERYHITFTDRERELLTTPDSSLCSRDERHKFILRMSLGGIQCPACLKTICRRAAAPDFDPAGSRLDRDYKCPFCDTQLTWHLGLVAGEEWFTIGPGQTVHVPPASND